MASSMEKALSEAGEGPPPDVPITIPDAHYAAMGKVADAWADLEFEVDQLIWYLLQTNQALGACVTAQIISIHPRLNAVRSLAQLWDIDAALLKALNTFIGEAEAMSTKRNRAIHDKRLVRWKTNEVVRWEVTARKELTFEAVPESIESLETFKDDILKKVDEFTKIRHAVMREIQSSPEKQRRRLPHILDARAPI